MLNRLLAAAFVCSSLGAEPAAKPERFEVSAIHPHDPQLKQGMRFSPSGEEASIFGLTIRNLIWLAWKLPPDLYDFQAKGPPARKPQSKLSPYIC